MANSALRAAAAVGVFTYRRQSQNFDLVNRRIKHLHAI
jgi:hypothetical protein